MNTSQDGEKVASTIILAYASSGALLLSGITIAARVPRLTRSPGWWLGALLFDLVVVWHLYIRSSLINTHIRAMMSPAGNKKGVAAAA